VKAKRSKKSHTTVQRIAGKYEIGVSCASLTCTVKDMTALLILHFFIASVCVPVQSINGLGKDYTVYCPKSSTIKSIPLDPLATHFSWKLFIRRPFLRNTFLCALCFLVTSAEVLSMDPRIHPHLPTERGQSIHMLLPSV